ncbi:MAG: response regulator [Myxococcota bacterium]
MARVLIVEDDPVTGMILARATKSAGHEAVLAVNGFDALHALEADGFDLVISDLLMPGMTGEELYDEIRSRPRFEALPIFLTTGAVAPEQLSWLDDAKGIELLQKPVKLAELVERISSSTHA